MSSDFIVFPATPEHADTMGEIHAEAWAVAYRPYFAPAFFERAVAHRRGKWHAVLAVLAEAEAEGAGADTVLLAARPGGRPLAYAYFGASPERPGDVEIFGFYNHPEAWGSGVAGTLMAATLDTLRARGFRRAHLWTLRDTAQSRRFYAKNGFTESGATRGHDFGDGNPIDQVEYEITL
ncbi:GNAT family N-acetyltransferase [Nonomuraea rhodomycinica]|uniref:GNAT family N-acetyltransferase n=1 Tax=Nonomuraea rhodomycinica TaxID=1712872 RepID=A0A7Y6IRV5_9ACTN|nr:GNAT family N-acetyltransferase [Nonomuraea rhodomycinica]NUW43257.1 GNAT family N-acetyltransferase [Nonomuraea rhodomycinica]